MRDPVLSPLGWENQPRSNLICTHGGLGSWGPFPMNWWICGLSSFSLLILNCFEVSSGSLQDLGTSEGMFVESQFLGISEPRPKTAWIFISWNISHSPFPFVPYVHTGRGKGHLALFHMEEKWGTTVEAEANGKDGTQAQIPLRFSFAYDKPCISPVPSHQKELGKLFSE